VGRVHGENLQPPFGKQLVAGDTWDWLVTLCDYSASAGYTLKLYLRGPQILDIIATAQGSDFKLHKDPVDTSKLTAGVYQWSAAVFDANQAKTTVGSGTVEIIADASTAKAGTDGRSLAKKMLDAIEAVLLDRNARIETSYQIDGRMLSLCTHDQLIKARGYWKSKYTQEQIESGELASDYNQVKVGFC
jgi:hypothetical protein